MQPSILDLFFVACAGVGFVVFMGIVAFAAEPHYAESRAALVRWARNRRAWNRTPAQDEVLPAGWCRSKTDRLREAIRRGGVR